VPVESRIPEITVAIPTLINRAVAAGAQIIAEGASDNLVRGGHIVNDELAPAIHTEREGVAEYAVVAGEKGGPFYAHMVEHGTTHSPPYPFLVPALEEHTDTVVALVAAATRGIE
jgi:HK97 gp10 family phage protein